MGRERQEARKQTEYRTYQSRDGREIVFPVGTVTGAKPGPHLVVTGGIHGAEYPGIAAAMRLFQELDPEALSGTVTIVTISSLTAYEARAMFVCPVDGKNPNRFFPGDPEGSYTEEMVYYLFRDIIRGADAHIDLHGGDMVEALEPFALVHTGVSPETDAACRQLALAYGLPNLVSTSSDGTWPDRGNNYANSAEHGIPSVIVEAGGIGQLEESAVRLHMRGLGNVLRHLKMLPENNPPGTGSSGLQTAENNPQEPVPGGLSGGIREYPNFVWLHTPEKGFYVSCVKVGDRLEKGQKTGDLLDYFGHRIREIQAPVAGRILFLTTSPAMAENGLIMGIGEDA